MHCYSYAKLDGHPVIFFQKNFGSLNTVYFLLIYFQNCIYFQGKMGKRLEDCKERYQKSCRKLHATHNEYVLMLSEASEFERDLRTILLPGLLEYQQAVQEDMIDKWKLILSEATNCCNR